MAGHHPTPDELADEGREKVWVDEGQVVAAEATITRVNHTVEVPTAVSEKKCFIKICLVISNTLFLLLPTYVPSMDPTVFHLSNCQRS